MPIPKGITILEHVDLRKFATPGALGVVNNVAYIGCFWPSLDEPTALFAEGSSGIYVQGPPTPRNVLFPLDTVALPTRCNRASYGEPPRYEELDIPTRLDVFFVRDFNPRTVIEDVEKTKTVEVEPGIFTEVRYWAPSEVQKTDKDIVVTDLNRDNAELVAATIEGKI